MVWAVEVTDQFAAWYARLDDAEVDAVNFSVGLLEAAGPELRRPHADTVHGSAYPNMKELRVQAQGRPIRILFAFDPRRVAILLIGGDKTGDDRFYIRMVPLADALYAEHLSEIEEN
ncbi:MAG: type II toxin-antitoxin system RelE/ParE family toxin [Candidatus Eremiobacteraeota bacterium]|nr:type II toxin-antitoxin system RelE/ParE family toxin [Candidatus Eremiobacteraeota bacterium]